MPELPDAIPEFAAAGMALIALCVVLLLIGSRRKNAALRTDRDNARAAHQALLSERDTALHERDAARTEAHHINSGRTALLEETQHLISERMPALLTHLAHQHVSVPGLKNQPFAGTEVESLHASALEQLKKAVASERERVDEAAQSVMRGATTVVQAQSYQLQSKIESMQHRYDTPDLAQDLLELDLLNEQNLRRIQATGVLCGASPGLTRVDSHLGDVVVGAQSRVRGYHRVQVTSQLDAPVAVVARAVEPVAITVSELLANAVHHSHGTLAVDVSLHQAESGAVIVVDDAGVGMHADELEFAARMLAGRDELRLSELGDPPRSGFATIGRLVRQYGFTVSVDKPAPYGGVRAVVLIPGHLLTLLNETERPMSAMAPQAPAVTHEPHPYASEAAVPQAHTPPAGTPEPTAFPDRLPAADLWEREPDSNPEPPVSAPEPSAADGTAPHRTAPHRPRAGVVPPARAGVVLRARAGVLPPSGAGRVAGHLRPVTGHPGGSDRRRPPARLDTGVGARRAARRGAPARDTPVPGAPPHDVAGGRARLGRPADRRRRGPAAQTQASAAGRTAAG
ncbi:sensor histidine kinase [Streptomyces sp. P38-E01]|uniref:histidine kinase n=1 Tax=Streptomyces tardus TaxID=2780544 RepID=A0A949JM08_9ACTN|nr:ATP-binding protein [Streptomyces tardus]MBU7597586.1 sensor histidine kinase [Streptomyces tardus]